MASSKGSRMRRMASLADEHEHETGTSHAAIPSSIPEATKLEKLSIEKADHPVVQPTKPKKDIRKLKLSEMETRDLISRYWMEVADEQEKKHPERGTMAIQVGYNVLKGHVCVKVLEGRHLPALDPTGSSDPYIALQPFPFDIFEDSASEVQRTKTKSKALAPTFLEMFHIRCRPSALYPENGCAILFSCYDADTFTGDDIIGEAVYLLPGTNSVQYESEVGSFDHITLPLSLPSEPTNRDSAYFELLKRTSDSNASDFIQSRKKAFKMADSERD